MKKIKTLNSISPKGLEVLTSRGYIVGGDVEAPDGILVRSANMFSMEPNPELLAIARAGAGTNNIPLESMSEKGIAVFNTPGANSDSVNELAVCSLLMASRDIIAAVNWVRSIAGEGDQIPELVEKGKSNFTGPELSGKTLGVVGLGAVGSKIAEAGLNLGMTVYGYDPYLSVEAAWHISGRVIPAADIGTIYHNCDYITLHVPYIDSTHHMVNSETIAKMKDGVRIINLARGELVSDLDIIAAIETGRVARYVTDFPNTLTAAVPGIIPMPHIGASTPESEDKCALMASEELIDYLENGNIQNSVNFPSCRLERQGISRLCVIHKNVPKMIASILDVTSEQNINVEHMINKARGEYAYTIIDLGSRADEEISSKISALEDVLRVRVID